MSTLSRRWMLISSGTVAAGFLAGCSSSSAPPSNAGATTAPGATSPSASVAPSTAASSPKIKVVATTSVCADFLKEIAGGRADVYTVIKPNVDAHEFEPTPADLKAMAEAAVIVKNGAGLENWFDKTIKASESKAKVVDASEGVKLRDASHEGGDDHEEGHDHGEHDPHIWHNPQFAKVMVANIGKGLAAADSAGASVYDAAVKAYSGKLDTLDTETEKSLSVLTNRKIVTNHDALGYYIDRYKLEFVGSIIPSFDSQAELSTKKTAELVRKIKDQKVKAVFSEKTIPPKTAEAIGRDAGVKVVQGDDAIYGDSLGAEGSDAATYLGMIRHNTKAIVDNLR